MEELNRNSTVTNFMRKLADDLENGKLSAKQEQKIGEFYMSWFFFSETQDEEISDQDFLKFLTLGWYIYRQIPKTDV